MKLAAWLQTSAQEVHVETAVILSQDSDVLLQGLLMQHVAVTLLHTTITERGE